jgi:hypothetical protein
MFNPIFKINIRRTTHNARRIGKGLIDFIMRANIKEMNNVIV